jgi:hypothetical protein
MMMTKEEITLAFDAIWFEANNSANLAGEDLQKEHNLIVQLINEHFELVDFLKRWDLYGYSIEDLDEIFDLSWI